MAAIATLSRAAFADDPSDHYQYRFEDQHLHVTYGSLEGEIDLGCVPRAALRQKNLLYVACGAAGVVQIDVTRLESPRILGRTPVKGAAVDVSLRGDRIWVEVVNADSQTASEEIQPFSLSLTYPVPPREVIYEYAAPTKPSIMAAPRFVGFEGFVGLTGFAATNSSPAGGGLIGSAHLSYRFAVPIVLRGEVTPFGFGGPRTDTNSQTGNVGHGLSAVAAGYVLAGVDTRYFEFTLGVGGATVNEPDQTVVFEAFVGDGFQGATTPKRSLSSPVFAQGIRIGAKDGVDVELDTLLFTNEHVRLAMVQAAFNLPVTAAVKLALRGGGGKVGYYYGDVAARIRLRGDNGRGTVALWTWAGISHVGLNACTSNPDPPFTQACNTTDATGPGVGVGIEWRP